MNAVNLINKHPYHLLVLFMPLPFQVNKQGIEKGMQFVVQSAKANLLRKNNNSNNNNIDANKPQV